MVTKAKAKGFRVPKRTAVLDFEGTDFDGAEAKCLFDVPLQVVFDFQRLIGSNDPDSQEQVVRKFGDGILTEWNLLDDEDQPYPATGDGMMALGAEFAVSIVQAWLDAVQAPSGKSEAPSPNGDTSEGAQTKTDEK